MIDNFKKSADGYQKAYISLCILIVSAPYILKEKSLDEVKLPNFWFDIPKNDAIYIIAVIYLLLQISLLLYAKQCNKIIKSSVLTKDDKEIIGLYPSLMNLSLVSKRVRIFIICAPISLFMGVSFILKPFEFQIGILPAILINFPIFFTLIYLPKGDGELMKLLKRT